MHPSGSDVAVSEPVVDPEEGKEVEAFVRREESERSEFAQKQVAEKIDGMLKQAHEYVVSSATSVSLTELQKIA